MKYDFKYLVQKVLELLSLIDSIEDGIDKITTEESYVDPRSSDGIGKTVPGEKPKP